MTGFYLLVLKLQKYWPIAFSGQPIPVQTGVCDSLHGVKVAVRPVDPLGDDIEGDPGWRAEPVSYQLYTITPIHEGALKLWLFVGITHVCEEHVAANKHKVKSSYMSTLTKIICFKLEQNIVYELLAHANTLVKTIKGTLWKHIRPQWDKKSCWISVLVWAG